MTVVHASYGGLSPVDRFLAIASAAETWHDANALRRRSGRLFEKAGDRLLPDDGFGRGEKAGSILFPQREGCRIVHAARSLVEGPIEGLDLGTLR
jgi:hypothetical protein